MDFCFSSIINVALLYEVYSDINGMEFVLVRLKKSH